MDLELVKHDPHRCGSAPFVPQIMPDGSQNSCGSYEYAFDKEGRNEYLAKYPDDEFINDYVCRGGDCNEFKKLDRLKPIMENNTGCCDGLNYSIQNNNVDAKIKGKISDNIVENFTGTPGPHLIVILLWIILLVVMLKLVCMKCLK